MTRKVVVNDRMQKDYVYWRTEPVGKKFALGFTPEVTPKEMLQLGVFGGKYLTELPEGVSGGVVFRHQTVC